MDHEQEAERGRLAKFANYQPLHYCSLSTRTFEGPQMSSTYLFQVEPTLTLYYDRIWCIYDTVPNRPDFYRVEFCDHTYIDLYKAVSWDRLLQSMPSTVFLYIKPLSKYVNATYVHYTRIEWDDGLHHWKVTLVSEYGIIVFTSSDKSEAISILNPWQNVRESLYVSQEEARTELDLAGTRWQYVHNQTSEDSVWVINHNFGSKPSVSVWSTGGVEVEAQIQHNSKNQTIVTFIVPMSGTARLTL